MKLLLIEDNNYSIQDEIDNLREDGWDVVECIDGDEALEQIESIHDFKLVILDIMLPRGQKLQLKSATDAGIALYREIRQRAPTVPVLILSARLKEDFWQEINADEKTCYLGKSQTSTYLLMETIDNLTTDP